MKDETREIARRLGEWYRASRRSLPWRGSRDPYAIWVSEVMLQQTTVAVARTRWTRFVARFPDVAALAAADERDVLAEWSGLGYYHRARNLHRAARVLASRAEVLPRDVGALRELPGIGAYTAAAIASIAFGVRAAAVDGNVVRVVARLFGLDVTLGSARDLARVARRAEELVPARDPGAHNQALMDLGATICTPRAPICPECPLRSLCRAAARGDPERTPRAKPRTPTVALRLAAGVASRGGAVVLVPDQELVKGHLVVPLARLDSGEGEGAPVLAAAWRRLAGREAAEIERLGSVRHSVLQRRYTVEVYRVTEAGRGARPAGVARVLLGEVGSLPRGGLLAKVLELAFPRASSVRAITRLRSDP